jgi:hypothetical protein
VHCDIGNNFDSVAVIIEFKSVLRLKTPIVDQIPVELICAGGETLHSEIHKLCKLIWIKEELPHQWRESIVIPVHKRGDETDCSNY